MSANDAIVLKANFDDWKKRVVDFNGVEPWLYYCVDQFIKPYDLDDEEINYGITDGGADGGADAIYIFVNQGHLVTEDSEFEPKTVSKIRLVIIQSKSSGGFKPTEIQKWIELIGDFFDLSKPANSFGNRYNDRVVRMMGIWKDKYLKIVSVNPPEISIDFYYITPDAVVPDDLAKDAGERVKVKVREYIKATCDIHYIGAKELWEQVQRRPPKNRTLTWAEQAMTTTDGHVGLVKLYEFLKFIQNEPGMLAEQIFESNVRGYQQHTSINEQIRLSLEDIGGVGNFWMLNNGVTIITPKAHYAGHLLLVIEDPQIVNGLQTSREIFSYAMQKGEEVLSEDTRTVLVRVIQTDEAELQDKIINATNNQNQMASGSLRMTDKIHRSIEELFKKFDLYYDRRKGYYRDQQKPIRKIVSANEMAQAVVSIILQRPDDARARPGDYFKKTEKYKSVFDNDNISLEAYLTCVRIVRRVENFIDDKNLEAIDKRNMKFYLAAFLAREITGLANPVSPKLTVFSDVSKIDEKIIQSCYERVRKIYNNLSKNSPKDGVAKGPDMLRRLNSQWNKRQKAITKE